MKCVGNFFFQTLKLKVSKVTLKSFKIASQHSLMAEDPPLLPVDLLLTLYFFFFLKDQQIDCTACGGSHTVLQA